MKHCVGVIIHEPLRQRLFSASDWDRLNRIASVRATATREPITDDDAAAILRDCTIAVSSWRTPGPSAKILESAGGLRLWVHAAGSVKKLFGPHLKGRDLMICSCRSAIARRVAEFALAQAICGVHRMFENSAANRRGPAPKPPDAKMLGETVIGIIGASETGRSLIELFGPFGPRVMLYDPTVNERDAESLGVELVSDLEWLCTACDVVSLHTPALPATRHMLGERHFGAMRDDTVFINTARGACVDERAMVAELEKGRLFAFIDVTDPEPAAADSPLRRLPNVVLTSHMAGAPSNLIGRQVVEDVTKFIDGEFPRHVVTEPLLGLIA